MIKKYLLQIIGIWELVREGYMSATTATTLENYLRSLAIEEIYAIL